MRTITIHKEFNVYTYEELNPDSKETALNDWNDWLIDNGYAWEQELFDSLQAIGKKFDVTFEIERYTDNIILDNYPDFSEEMNFKRSIAYINNHFNFKEFSYNYRKQCEKVWKNRNNYKHTRKDNLRLLPVYYFCHTVPATEKYYSDNMLTGYCEDYIIFQAYERFIKKQKERDKYNSSQDAKTDLYYQKRKNMYNLTLYDFFEMLADIAQENRDNDRKYQQSEEYFIEHAEANNYEFTEDGKLYW